VSRIVLTSSTASERERLARISGSDEIHRATPRITVEGSEITVDRSAVEQTIFHAPREDRSGVDFPLHKTERP
jgi:hypothetical protein